MCKIAFRFYKHKNVPIKTQNNYLYLLQIVIIEITFYILKLTSFCTIICTYCDKKCLFQKKKIETVYFNLSLLMIYVIYNSHL